MNITLLLAYATLSAGFGAYSLYHVLFVDHGRQQRLEAADRIVLAGVGLLSSAAWPLLVPVYAVGWLRSGEGRRARARVRSLVQPGGGAAGRRAIATGHLRAG